MKSLDFLNEGIAEDAHEMHLDHEVQMARQELYHAAEDAIALHKLLRHVSEQQGLEGWVSSKITLAADYLNTIREHLEYQLMSGGPAEGITTMVGDAMPVAEGSLNEISTDLISKARDAAGMKWADADDRGDKKASKKYNAQDSRLTDRLNAKKAKEKAKEQGVAEGRKISEGGMKKQMEADAERMDLDQFLDRYVHRPEDKEWVSEFWRTVNGVEEGESTTTQTTAPTDNAPYVPRDYQTKEPLTRGADGNYYNSKGEQRDNMHGGPLTQQGTAVYRGMMKQPPQPARKVNEMSAGSVATVVNPPAKNKAKVGSLFGGTYKQKQTKAK